nr:hypothetical protein [uncultured Cohaesibacter sp.]
MIRYILLALLLLTPAVHAEECANGALYEAEDNDGNLQTLKTSGPSDPFVLEKQADGQAVWTIEAEQGCSNGNSACWLQVVTTDEEPVDVPVETISEDGQVKYYVFAHLRQTLVSMKMNDEQFDTVADWHMARPDDFIAGMALPVNVYRFKSCR